MITIRFISLGFLAVGIFVLMQVILPIISFQIWEVGQKIENKSLSSPGTPQNQILGVSIQTKDNFPGFYSTKKRDNLPYSEFNITIPKININGVSVYVDSNDLSKGIVQLPGTALPGERGNLFISAHSALNTFWAKGAYFAKLTDVKIGDKVEIEAGGSNFVYQIIGIKAVDPTDVSVISPPDETGRYLTLMTCVPPGLNFQRLVVLGKML